MKLLTRTNRKDPTYIKLWRSQRLKEGYCVRCDNFREDLNKNACVTCRQKGNANTKARYKANPQRHAIETANRRLKYKLIVFNHYNHECSCCKEKRFEFLQVDHINGGGVKHRKIINTRIYTWLIEHKFPIGFRLLCANCNWSRGIYGYCPHEKESCLY